MKDAKMYVIRKPHQGDEVVENVLNYMISSPFAYQDDIMTYEVSCDSFDQMVYDMHDVQALKPMENHRGLFHLVLSTRPSNAAQRILDAGAQAILEYFEIIGHQAVVIPHYGSTNNSMNYHYHIALNPISLDGKRRLHDKWGTFCDMVAYLNENTPNNWTWQYTTPAIIKKNF